MSRKLWFVGITGLTLFASSAWTTNVYQPGTQNVGDNSAADQTTPVPGTGLNVAPNPGTPAPPARGTEPGGTFFSTPNVTPVTPTSPGLAGPTTPDTTTTRTGKQVRRTHNRTSHEPTRRDSTSRRTAR